MHPRNHDPALESYFPRRHVGGVLVLTLMKFAGCRETSEQHYPTLKDAEQAGEVRRGWLPRWTPTSARDIAQVHNLDTNLRLLAFSFDSYTTEAFLKACSPIQHARVLPPSWVPVKWWPSELRRDIPAQSGFKFFLCVDREDQNFAAIGEKARRAFVWNAPG